MKSIVIMEKDCILTLQKMILLTILVNFNVQLKFKEFLRYPIYYKINREINIILLHQLTMF